MEFQNKMVKFGLYTAPLLEKAKAELGLHLPVRSLAVAAAYYQKTLHRDPTVDEIRILDALWQSKTESPELIAVTELLTNDAEVAETYADMMSKRRELLPDTDTPATLPELFRLANEYLRRAGKAGMSAEQTFLLEDRLYSPSSASGSTYALHADARFGLRAVNGQNPNTEIDDVWVILKPNTSAYRFRRALEKLWRTPALTREIKAVRLIGKQGLLCELLSGFEGVAVDLSHLDGQDPTTDQLVGRYLIRVAGNRFADFAKALRPAGITAGIIAKPQRNAELRLVAKNTPHIVWSYDFLNAALISRPSRVTLANEQEGTDAPICTRPLTTASSTYLAVDHSETRSLVSLSEKTACAVATCKPQDRFFHNAFGAALAPVLKLAVAGVDFTKISLAVALTLPPMWHAQEEQIGAALSSILGLYRLQTELGIRMAAGKIVCNSDATLPELTVYALTGENTVDMPCFDAVDHSLYCLAPQAQPCGLPDMNELRRLLLSIADLRRCGSLAGARPLLGETVAEAMQGMTGNGVSALPPYDFDGIEAPARYGVLLEVSGELDAIEISRTVAYEAEETETAPALAETECLIPRASATVVTLVANEEDADARVLADALEDRGAVVLQFTPPNDNTVALARAVLGSQALIVCRDVTLTPDAYLKFALETLARANGYILFPARQKAPKMKAAVAIAGGLTAEMLDQIAKK